MKQLQLKSPIDVAAERAKLRALRDEFAHLAGMTPRMREAHRTIARAAAGHVVHPATLAMAKDILRSAK